MGFKSTFANYLLCTPYARMAIVPKEISQILSEDVFLNELYVKPIFQEKAEVENEADDLEDGLYDSMIIQSDIDEELDELRDYYQKFIYWLDDFSLTTIYTLSGHAGTGKTTFVHKLTTIKNEYEWIIFDLDRAVDVITWYGDEKTEITKFYRASRKMYSIVIRMIRDLVFGLYNPDSGYQDPNRIITNLNLIIDNYTKSFASAAPSGNGLIKNLQEKINKDDSDMDNTVKCAQIFKQYFDELNKKNETEDIHLLQRALDVLLLFLMCKNVSSNKVLVFDNIERFVAKDEIYNQDVIYIQKSLRSYIMDQNAKGRIYYGRIKIMLVARLITAKYYGARVHSMDAEANVLDISRWFDTGAILDKKIQWLKKNDLYNRDFETAMNIIRDQRKCRRDNAITGLKKEIDPLFNYNARLLSDFIGIIVEERCNSQFIDKARSMMSMDSSISRFGARSIVRGLLLHRLQEKENLFGQLYTYSRDNNAAQGKAKKQEKMGLGTARKILTILYMHTRYGEFSDQSIQLSELLKRVLNIGDVKQLSTEDQRTVLKTIAEILYYMNSYDRQDNDWIQFIDIQFKSSKSSIKLNEPKDLEEKIINNADEIEVGIMPAGIAYLKYIVASFEFFSVRYVENYRPLFSTVPDEQDLYKVKRLEELECYRIIHSVYNAAKNCIFYMKGSNNPDYSIIFDSKKKENVHCERIIEQHTAYLSRFEQLIKEQSKDKCPKTRDLYNDLIKKIDSIRNRYRQLNK